MKYYSKALQNYLGFSGRARRKEYWMFVLFYYIFGIAALILDRLLGLSIPNQTYGYIYLFYTLAMFFPALALFVRRMHDVGKSGFVFFLAFIPLIGVIILLVWACTEGEYGENEYGINP